MNHEFTHMGRKGNRSKNYRQLVRHEFIQRDARRRERKLAENRKREMLSRELSVIRGVSL